MNEYSSQSDFLYSCLDILGSGKNILNGGKNMLNGGKNILNDGKCELDLDYILELQKPGQKGRTGFESVCNLLFAVREQTCLVHLRESRPNKCFSGKYEICV